MEGEIRYYNNQVALSTLTITLVEKEIQAPFALIVTDHVKMRVEVEEVAKAQKAALKAVEELQGRVTKSELKQHKAGQLEAILQPRFRPPTRTPSGRNSRSSASSRNTRKPQKQEAEGGTGPAAQKLKPKINDVHFEVVLNNIVNIQPRNSVTLLLATTDVIGNYAKLRDAVLKSAKGQIRDAKLNEQDKQNVNAVIDFNVPIAQKAAIDKVIAEVGPMLTKSTSQAPLTELATEQKFGYVLTLRSVANIAPREVVAIKIEVKDVDKRVAELKDMVKVGKGRVADSTIARQESGQVIAGLVFDVPLAVEDLLVKNIKDAGNLLSQQTTRNPNVPDNDLATAQIVVTLSGVQGKTPREVVAVKIEVKDVDKKVAELKDLVRASKGRVIDEKGGGKANGQISTKITFEVPFSAQDALVQQFKSSGDLVSYESARNPQVPDNDLATAHLIVTVNTASQILPTEEGSFTVKALVLSYTVFAYCLLAILVGLSAVVPIGTVIFVVYWLSRKIWSGPALESVKPVERRSREQSVIPDFQKDNDANRRQKFCHTPNHLLTIGSSSLLDGTTIGGL